MWQGDALGSAQDVLGHGQQRERPAPSPPEATTRQGPGPGKPSPHGFPHSPDRETVSSNPLPGWKLRELSGFSASLSAGSPKLPRDGGTPFSISFLSLRAISQNKPKWEPQGATRGVSG